jgi:hypothetical protein
MDNIRGERRNNKQKCFIHGLHAFYKQTSMFTYKKDGQDRTMSEQDEDEQAEGVSAH